MQPSPYTPGEIARAVPGRVRQLAEFDERLSYMVDLRQVVGRIRVDHAPRGVGKTSLLRQYQHRADEYGVMTVWVTAGEREGLIGQIASEIHRTTKSWADDVRARIVRTIEALNVSIGVPGVVHVGARFKNQAGTSSPAGVREFEDVIRATVSADNVAGLMIFIDEIQAADPDGLRTLVYGWQHFQAEGRDIPAGVFAAGLPSTPDVVSSAVTFTERLAFRSLDLLDAEAMEAAIRIPAQEVGVQWDPGAIVTAGQIAAGYPYSVQLIADSAWVVAGRPDPGGSITVDDVSRGKELMQEDLEALFRARWANAAEYEQALMAAMATSGDYPVQRSEIARIMGVTTSALSVPRARLIDKGFIQPSGHGRVEFTIPGFAAFIRNLEE